MIGESRAGSDIEPVDGIPLVLQIQPEEIVLHPLAVETVRGDEPIVLQVQSGAEAMVCRQLEDSLQVTDQSLLIALQGDVAGVVGVAILLPLIIPLLDPGKPGVDVVVGVPVVEEVRREQVSLGELPADAGGSGGVAVAEVVGLVVRDAGGSVDVLAVDASLEVG